MQDKLKELTQKIYSEGVEKAKKEADEILANAKKEADEVIANAKKEAEGIKESAEKESAELKTKIEAELKLTSTQALTALKQKIETVITSKIADVNIKDAAKDSELFKKVIEIVVKSWSEGKETSDLKILLPQELKSELDTFINTEVKKSFDGNLEVKADENVSGGFIIGPADGSYKVNFTEESYKEFIKSYLRQRVKELLF